MLQNIESKVPTKPNPQCHPDHGEPGGEGKQKQVRGLYGPCPMFHTPCVPALARLWPYYTLFNVKGLRVAAVRCSKRLQQTTRDDLRWKPWTMLLRAVQSPGLGLGLGGRERKRGLLDQKILWNGVIVMMLCSLSVRLAMPQSTSTRLHLLGIELKIEDKQCAGRGDPPCKSHFNVRSAKSHIL